MIMRHEGDRLAVPLTSTRPPVARPRGRAYRTGENFPYPQVDRDESGAISHQGVTGTE